ncbi:hypothetical protein V6Z12_1Z010200 [Gossypium hirsutum]
MFTIHCFALCLKSMDMGLSVSFWLLFRRLISGLDITVSFRVSNLLISICLFFFFCFLCTFSSGIQKWISSSPNAIKLIVFSFIRISLAYTELKRIYEGFLFSYSKSHCYVLLKLWISVWASVLAFGPVPSLVYGLLGFYPAWRLSDPICKCTKTKVSLLWTSAIHINPRYLSTI